MSQNKHPDGGFSSLNLLAYLYKWRRPILIMTGVAFVLSVLFSCPLFITPKFSSSVILFPTSSNSISKALLTERVDSKQDILQFGEDEQVEQMLQILASNRIRDRIIEKYDLLSHYRIKPTEKYRHTKLIKEYESNIKFRRTEYMGVLIRVMDHDADTAALIANDIAELLDSTKSEMQHARARRALQIVEEEYYQLRDEVQRMEDSLTILRHFGVHDYETQAEMINQQLAIEIAKGNNSGVKALEKKLEILATYGGPYVSLRDQLEHEKKQLSHIKAKYEEAKVDAEQVLPQKFVVSRAFRAEKKSYPVRWLIVLVTTLGAFFLTILVILIVDNVGQLREEKKKPGANRRYKKKNQPPSNDRQKELMPLASNDEEGSVGRSAFRVKEPTKKITVEHVESLRIKAGGAKEQRSRLVLSKSQKNMENYFSNLNLLKLINKWKFHLLIILFLALVGSAFLSGPRFVKPRFKSVAIVYPSNIAPYSDESETEQMLQWFGSQDIKDRIVEIFDLGKHWGIDKNYKHYYSTMMYEYGRNIKISKTMYESVAIEVTDYDAQRACDIANELIKLYNQKIRKIHRAKYREVVDAYERMMAWKMTEIDSVESVLYDIRTTYGIVDYGTQSHEMARGFLRTVDGAGNARINTQEVNKLKNNMELHGGEFVIANTRLYKLMEEYNLISREYDIAKKELDKEFSYTNVVSYPYPADKKSSPVRWLIVLVTLVATFLVSMFVISLVENHKLREELKKPV
ncbi:MAG: hypothetical protein CSA95_05045 [Bacteroidetes bacterium]|nr:MAG: hypothetical protein CSA95_05045 [Bacteroidota bacterium]